MSDQCSAFSWVKNDWLYSRCKNGFPQTGDCLGKTNSIPICCNEVICERLYPDTGTPKETFNSIAELNN